MCTFDILAPHYIGLQKLHARKNEHFTQGHMIRREFEICQFSALNVKSHCSFLSGSH